MKVETSQDHSWLWASRKQKQQVLSEEEFVIAVRLRLGADLIDDAITCAYCHEQTLDSSGHHALVRAGSHAVRGHAALSCEVMGWALQTDPAAESEPVGIVAQRSTLRPPGILCATTHGRCDDARSCRRYQ